MEKNKTGMYFKYAIGEIILVVIGILIALQINTWNQEHQNTREEQRILKDLSEELQFNKFLLQNGRDKMQEVINASDRLLAKINEVNADFSEENFNQDIENLTLVWVSGRQTSIYDVLSSSGDFDLISSSLLRNKLADLKRNQELLLKFEEVQSSFVDNHLRPFLNKNLDRTKVRTILNKADLVTSRYTTKFPPNTNEILQNREFANLLEDLIFFTKRIVDNYDRIDKDNAQIDSLIHVKYPDMFSNKYIPY